MNEPLESLVTSASRGDSRALNELFERNLPGLLGYVRVHAGARLREMESSFDLVQSACREVLRDIGLHEFKDEAGFRQWLYTAAERKILDRARYHARPQRDSARSVPLSNDASRAEAESLRRAYERIQTPSEAAGLREDWRAVEAALAKLPGDYREVIVLAYLVGLPHDEIARKLARTPGATRVLLHRAVARLASLLGTAR
jgi:RNA polymerase sigma-70 factor (ECF subfamily)